MAYVSLYTAEKGLFLQQPQGTPHNPACGNTSFRASAWTSQGPSVHTAGALPPLLCTSDTLSPSSCRLKPSVSSWCTLTQDRPVENNGRVDLTWFEAKVQRHASKGWKQKGYRKNEIQSCLQYFLFIKDIQPKCSPWTADHLFPYASPILIS